MRRFRLYHRTACEQNLDQLGNQIRVLEQRGRVANEHQNEQTYVLDRGVLEANWAKSNCFIDSFKVSIFQLVIFCRGVNCLVFLLFCFSWWWWWWWWYEY